MYPSAKKTAYCLPVVQYMFADVSEELATSIFRIEE
jgi:hypothetical protein